MIGAIAGDVLGSVYEAQTTKEKNFRLFHELGRPTDDSVLTLAVAATVLDSAGTDIAAPPTANDFARRLREFGGATRTPGTVGHSGVGSRATPIPPEARRTTAGATDRRCA